MSSPSKDPGASALVPPLIAAAIAGMFWAANALSGQDHREHVVASAAPAPRAAVTSVPTAKPEPAGSQTEAVRAYYDAINSKKWETAYSLLSPAAQKRHTYSAFVAYQSLIDGTQFTVVGQQGDTVLVTVREHHTDDAANFQVVTGGWHVIASPDGLRWLLDEGVFSSPKEVAIAPIAAPTQPSIDASSANGGSPQAETWPSAQQSPPTSSVPSEGYDSAPTFHGFVCKEETCIGHRRGYEWAEEKGIDNPHTCYSGPRLSNPTYVSFSEGCEAYVDDSTGAARLEPDERYADAESTVQQ